MAMDGYSSEAIVLICDTYGPGKLRCELIEIVFDSTSNSELAASLFAALEFGDEMDAACEGIGRRLSVTSSPDKVDLTSYLYLGDRIDTMLGTFAERYFTQHLKGTSEEISKAFSDAFDLPMSKATSRETLLKLYALAPFDSWDKVSVGAIQVSDDERQKMLAQMFNEDPVKAVERIESTKGGEADFTAAFKQWLEIDAGKPIDWFQSNLSRLTAVQKDYAIRGIAEYSASHGDCNVAWKWVGEITSYELRKKVEGQIWSMERDVVRRGVSIDPQVTLQGMVTGNSSHQDYWIEEAMGTWMAKDMDKANEWYQQNWKSLPPSKSQYVAAAFAKQAANQGDTATARQWATHIQDAKTRDRINSLITKAEANPKP